MYSEINNLEGTYVETMSKGIGRMASDEELVEYLSGGINEIPIDLDEAFLKYSIRKNRTLSIKKKL